MSAGRVSRLNKKVYGKIDGWRNRPIEGSHLYIFLNRIYLKRSCGGEVRNIAILIAVGVNADGFTEILGVVEGAREEKESWMNFLRHLKKSEDLKEFSLWFQTELSGLLNQLQTSTPMLYGKGVWFTSTEMYLPEFPTIK